MVHGAWRAIFRIARHPEALSRHLLNPWRLLAADHPKAAGSVHV